MIELKPEYMTGPVEPQCAEQWYKEQGIPVKPGNRKVQCWAVAHPRGDFAAMGIVILDAYNPAAKARVDTISTVYTDPRYRQQGFGRALMERIRKEHPDAVLSVYNTNQNAIDLYTSLGYRHKQDTSDGRQVMALASLESDPELPLPNHEGYGKIKANTTVECAQQIESTIRAIGLKNPLKTSKLHVTLMYDSANPVKYDGNKARVFRGRVSGWGVIGEGKWRSVMLKVNSPDLHSYHLALKNYGLTHSHPNFLPHISLKYKPTEEDIRIVSEGWFAFSLYPIVLIEQPWGVAL